jgi:hypothetical protein
LDPKWFKTSDSGLEEIQKMYSADAKVSEKTSDSDLEMKNLPRAEIIKIRLDPKVPEKRSNPDLEIKKRIMKEIKYCSQNVLKISDFCKEMYCKTN